MLWAGSFSGLFCKERLVGQVCGSAMMVWQQWTAAEATVRDTGTQKVERHMGDSSTGPTLRRYLSEGGKKEEGYSTQCSYYLLDYIK